MSCFSWWPLEDPAHIQCQNLKKWGFCPEMQPLRGIAAYLFCPVAGITSSYSVYVDIIWVLLNSKPEHLRKAEEHILQSQFKRYRKA